MTKLLPRMLSGFYSAHFTVDFPFQNTVQILIKLYIPVPIYSTVASSFEIDFGTSMIGYYEARSRYHVHLEYSDIVGHPSSGALFRAEA